MSTPNKYRKSNSHNDAKPLCSCGKENCPNPGIRTIDRPVKGSITSTTPPESGPRYKGDNNAS